MTTHTDEILRGLREPTWQVPAPEPVAPTGQELRERVDSALDRPIDAAIAAVQHWELWQSNNGFIKNEDERSEQDRLRAFMDETRSQAVDAIVQLIEGQRAEERVRYAMEHTNNVIRNIKETMEALGEAPDAD